MAHRRLDRSRRRPRGRGRMARAASPAAGGRVMDQRPIYMISVAADLVGMHPQTLRIYEQKGLVRPQRTPGNTRLYSEQDLDRLRLIQRLTSEFGLNLAGVEVVLRMEDEVARLRRRIDLMEQRMREAVRDVERRYKRELVLYEPLHQPARRSRSR